jgi:integrase
MHYRNVPKFVADLRLRDATSARAFEFLILTACRSGEVRGAKWDEIDLTAAVWTIPAERMKARVEHRVPLGPSAVALLRQRLAAEPTQSLVFPSAKAGSPLSDMTFKALMLRMKVGGATAHGFRSSFRDWAGDEYGASDDVAEAALAHQWGNKVKRAYRRNPAFERRRELMIAWECYCTGAAWADNVVRLRA